MNLADKMKNAAAGELSDKAVETALRAELAPLLSFLEQAQSIDDGYPDNYPSDKRAQGQRYIEDGLNIEKHGHTLEHLVSFNSIPEKTDGREGQGRFLSIDIWAKEHHLYGDDSLLTSINLFESGKVRTWPQEYTVTRDFNPSVDTLQMFEIILRGYLDRSIKILDSFHNEDILNSGPYQRTQALAEIAADIYNRAFTPETPAQGQDWLPIHGK